MLTRLTVEDEDVQGAIVSDSTRPVNTLSLSFIFWSLPADLSLVV